MFFALMLLSLAGCRQQDVEEASVSLSAKDLTFAKDGGREVITVTSTGSEWSAFSTDSEWLTVSRSGDKLTVEASPNLKGHERKATVVVLAGAANGKIEVRQTKADIVLSLSDTEVTIPTRGGVKYVTLETNAETWSIEEIDEETSKWLKILKGGGLLIFDVARNNTMEARTGYLYINIDGERKEISITQPGLTKFILPCPPTDFDMRRLIDFELARGSEVMYLSESAEYSNMKLMGEYKFLTPSKYMNMLTYYTNDARDNVYARAESTIWFKQGQSEPVELKEFIEFLIENGYEKMPDPNTKWIFYRNTETRMRVAIKVVMDASVQGAKVQFDLLYVQPQPFATFDRVPLGEAGVVDLLVQRKKLSEIMTLEQSLGSAYISELTSMGEVNPEETAIVTFKPQAGNKTEELRTYILYTTKSDPKKSPAPELIGSPEQISFYWQDLSLALWDRGDGEMLMTREFEKLMTDAGYDYFYKKKEFYAFKKQYNDTTNIILFVTPVEYDFVFGGKKSLNVSLQAQKR